MGEKEKAETFDSCKRIVRYRFNPTKFRMQDVIYVKKQLYWDRKAKQVHAEWFAYLDKGDCYAFLAKGDNKKDLKQIVREIKRWVREGMKSEWDF